MTEDKWPTASLILGQFDLQRKDLPFKEDAQWNPVDQVIYRSKKDSYLYVYYASKDHWNCFVESFL